MCDGAIIATTITCRCFRGRNIADLYISKKQTYMLCWVRTQIKTILWVYIAKTLSGIVKVHYNDKNIFALWSVDHDNPWLRNVMQFYATLMNLLMKTSLSIKDGHNHPHPTLNKSILGFSERLCLYGKTSIWVVCTKTVEISRIFQKICTCETNNNSEFILLAMKILTGWQLLCVHSFSVKCGEMSSQFYVYIVQINILRETYSQTHELNLQTVPPLARSQK